MLGCKSPSSLAFMKLSASQAAHTLACLIVTQKSEREDYYNLYFINEKSEIHRLHWPSSKRMLFWVCRMKYVKCEDALNLLSSEVHIRIMVSFYLDWFFFGGCWRFISDPMLSKHTVCHWAIPPRLGYGF